MATSRARQCSDRLQGSSATSEGTMAGCGDGQPQVTDDARNRHNNVSTVKLATNYQVFFGYVFNIKRGIKANYSWFFVFITPLLYGRRLHGRR
ncbi:uncharacterized protein [Aegilops tauschii subsp. strangulata]|uniref:uncharacterized protein isoform X5 n=1 Tax=Aegilops tauschii subsp. strangulata TaxID=200361 RepID=UPI001ABC8A55|nr:uncharacterized protein LOC109736443 isoform X3 [Aegilops tauschii subsp. strangulata]